MYLRRSIAALVALAAACQAPALVVTLPNATNAAGQPKTVDPIWCVNPTTGNAERCGGGNSDGNGDTRAPRYTITPYRVSLSANTSTTLLGVVAGRAAFDIQCTGTAAVAVSRTGATITSADPAVSGSYDLIVPSGTTPYYIAQVASRTQAVTVYSTSAQACWGVSYVEQ